jgi:hypothetical protein
MIIIGPMLAAGVKPGRTFVIAMLTGLVEVLGTLIIKGTARKGMYRLFFLLEDGRKIIAPVFRWQRYLNFFDIPNGTELMLTFADGRDGKTYLKKMEPVA